MNPLISVLLVTYNGGHFLQLAVDSILGQSHQNLELVLVDNASSDSSVETLAKTCTDNRLKIIRLLQNQFHNGGLNAGLPHCTGDYIAIMDADDVSLPHRLEKQLAALKSDPSLAAIGSAALTINSEGSITGREFTLCAPEEIRLFTQYDMPFIFPTLMGRRQLFADFSFHPGLTMAHDLDFIACVLGRCKLGCMPEVLLHYRRHPQSTTSSKLATLIANASVVRLTHARRAAGQPEILDELLAEKDQLLKTKPAPGCVFAHYARCALNASLLNQAIWHARKAAINGSRIIGMTLATQALVASRRLPAKESRFLWRLAFAGSVKAYHLHPLN